MMGWHFVRLKIKSNAFLFDVLTMQFYIREFLDHRIFNLFLKEKKKRIFFGFSYCSFWVINYAEQQIIKMKDGYYGIFKKKVKNK